MLGPNLEEMDGERDDRWDGFIMIVMIDDKEQDDDDDGDDKKGTKSFIQ